MRSLFLYTPLGNIQWWAAVACTGWLGLAACSPTPGGAGAEGHVLEDNPALEHQFHQANEKLKAGHPEQALKLYTAISVKLEKMPHTDILSKLFAGTSELRRGSCLVEIGKPLEAKAVLESRAMRRYIKAFDSATMYDYCMVYGNLLGSMKKIESADAIFKKALAVAADELNNPEKCQEVWTAVLKWGKASRNWKYLDIQSRRALAYGMQNDDILIRHAAGEAQCFADVGLGNYKKARKEIQIVLQRLKKLHEPFEKIQEFRDLLNSIPRKQ